jgi:ArsR family transcriptional regulator
MPGSLVSTCVDGSLTKTSTVVNIDADEYPVPCCWHAPDRRRHSTRERAVELLGCAVLRPAGQGAPGAEDAVVLARTLRAIAEPARLRLLSLVAAHEGGEACVCELTEPLGLAQPTVSHHLKVLVDAGLLTREKRGVWAYFTLVPGALDAVADVLTTRAA